MVIKKFISIRYATQLFIYYLKYILDVITLILQFFYRHGVIFLSRVYLAFRLSRLTKLRDRGKARNFCICRKIPLLTSQCISLECKKDRLSA